MLGDFLTRCLILLLGYAYPGFECYKTIERNRAEREELIFWCQYWVIVAMFTVVEKFADVAVGWFPLYDEMKLALFIYLWYPKTKGTGYVYDTILRPYVSSHENDIDNKFQEWRARAWDLAIFYWKNCTELGQTAFWQVLDYLAGQSAKFSGKSTTNNKKNKKRGDEGPTLPAPSAPPLPTLREAFFDNGNGSDNNNTNNTLNRRNVSDAPRPVNFHIDPHTGYLIEEESPENYHARPNGIREKLRHLRK